jgi:hypothetical protein
VEIVVVVVVVVVVVELVFTFPLEGCGGGGVVLEAAGGDGVGTVPRNAGAPVVVNEEAPPGG